METPEVEFTRVALLENMVEAQLMESILQERDIPYRIRSFHDTAYDGLFQVQKGWGELHAPEAFEKEVKEIFDDIRRGDAGSPPEMPDEAGTES